MNPLKIAIVIPSFYPAVVYGGWVFSSWHTCRELAKLGVESYVSTTNDNGSSSLESNPSVYKEIYKLIFIKYYQQTIKERLSLSMIIGLKKDLAKADVVHIQGIFSIPTPLGLFYANQLKKPILLSPHGCLGEWCLSDGKSGFKKPYLHYLIAPYANKITWHATCEQEQLEILALFPSAKVAIIPNGIVAEEFLNPEIIAREEYLQHYTNIANSKDKIVISMARLHKKKGLDILIDAFAKVLKSEPETTLLIAGEDFGEKDKLTKQIQRLNISNKVFLVGQLEGQEKINFFANADIFALSSHNENFGIVYAEAMASGTPILASTHTPWQEVEQLSIGKWVPNTPSATATALIQLLHTDTAAMGKEAREFITQNYSWKKVAEKFKHLFLELRD
jgi:glycosyltransferase involved in cell wall biosynthesis